MSVTQLNYLFFKFILGTMSVIYHSLVAVALGLVLRESEVKEVEIVSIIIMRYQLIITSRHKTSVSRNILSKDTSYKGINTSTQENHSKAMVKTITVDTKE